MWRYLVLVLAFSLLIFSWALRNQSLSQSFQQANNKSEIPLVERGTQHYSTTDEQAKRRAKGKKYDKETSVVHPSLVEIAEVRHWPTDFPAIPVAKSNVVLIGQVTDAKAYLSPNETGVYSEFSVLIKEVLKNVTPEPLKSGDRFTVEREGGRVRYPSGHISKYYIAGLGMPRPGHTYVLFIVKEGDSYSIATAYELQAGAVSPLDQSGVVNFDKYKGWAEADFLNEVRKAVAVPSQSSPR